MGVGKDRLFSLIKEKLPKNVLFTDEIADALDISYDASYRRINGKTSLSLEEALKLAKHYQIPLNDLMIQGNGTLKGNDKESYVNIQEFVIDFYKDVSLYIKSHAYYKASEVYYAAKDIPIYHTTVGSMYSKFRLYVHFLSKVKEGRLQPFSDFIKNESFTDESKDFRDAFKDVSVIDIWSDTTINSCLHSLYYFYKTKLISQREALQMCEEVLFVIESVEKKSKNEVWNKEKKLGYQLYYSRLINVSHAMLIKSKEKKGLLIPYASLSYMKIEDETICNEVDVFFQRQLQFSKKISGSTEVDRKLFFMLMYDKIEQLKRQIEDKSIMSFV